MKTNFENIGGSYSQQGDYLLPNLTLSDENQSQIGVWGTRHKRYLKSNHRVLYYNFLTSGKLDNYLSNVERQAENLFEQTVKSLAEQERVTEKLKAENMMLWVQKMNNIRNRTTEIVNEQVIYR
ncbi:MAG: TnpV protein [Clostridia bacterium]|nr:TnpV protein [Clostridia bacterium]